MAKSKTIRSKGKGWFKQPIRHSRARKYGRAGGVYKSQQKRVLANNTDKINESKEFNSDGREVYTRVWTYHIDAFGDWDLKRSSEKSIDRVTSILKKNKVKYSVEDFGGWSDQPVYMIIISKQEAAKHKPLLNRLGFSLNEIKE